MTGGEIDICTWQERIVQLFEKNTYSVVNIFDVTLRPQLNLSGVVEVFLLILLEFFLSSSSFFFFFYSFYVTHHT